MKNKALIVGLIFSVCFIFSMFGVVKALDGININIDNAVLNFGGASPVGMNLGGYTAGHSDSADGYKVDGTSVINGSGQMAADLVIAGATTTISATTSNGDLLLTAAQICDGGEEIELQAGIDAGAFTLTLPTAALLAADCLSTNGSKTIWVDNNSGDNATVTAGTGGDMLEGDSLNVVIATARQVSIEIQMTDGGNKYRAAVVEWQDAD